jgi:hypothetical protein
MLPPVSSDFPTFLYILFHSTTQGSNNSDNRTAALEYAGTWLLTL